jgi:hypothetical protein
VDRILYEEAADDLRMHYRTTGKRDLKDAEELLRHLQPFFRIRRISWIGTDDMTRYTAARQAEGKTNSTINWELAQLSRMPRLAYENRKFIRLPLIQN